MVVQNRTGRAVQKELVAENKLVLLPFPVTLYALLFCNNQTMNIGQR
jgi:hypothetical protein